MDNRIRHFRKQRDMTLAELARKVGTTAQSISRLETGHMTLSTDWLAKLAEAFRVHPTDLLEQPERKSIPFLGVIGADGRAAPGEGRLTIDVAADDPVAVRLGAGLGRYEAGDILIADRLSAENIARGLDRDCLAAPEKGAPLLCRAIASARAGRFTLVPLAAGAPLRDTRLGFLAAIVMRISYY